MKDLYAGYLLESSLSRELLKVKRIVKYITLDGRLCYGRLKRLGDRL